MVEEHIRTWVSYHVRAQQNENEVIVFCYQSFSLIHLVSDRLGPVSVVNFMQNCLLSSVWSCCGLAIRIKCQSIQQKRQRDVCHRHAGDDLPKHSDESNGAMLHWLFWVNKKAAATGDSVDSILFNAFNLGAIICIYHWLVYQSLNCWQILMQRTEPNADPNIE